VIRSFSDHAANERTFLAWVRTGIAVIAFGFVVEKFNLFVRSLADAATAGSMPQIALARAAGGLGREEGIALIIGGAILIVVATFRFVRITRLIDDAQTHSAGSVRVELIFSGALLLGLAGLSAYLLLD
jgi:putative membrane protein